MVKRTDRRGFTMVELIVVLVIVAILVAIAVPALTGYIHLSQFNKNNSYAKTLYYAAEANLTQIRSSGQWEELQENIIRHGLPNESLQGGDQVYALRLNAGEYSSGNISTDGALLLRILGESTYDPELLDAAIALEVDVTSGKAYSVFYGSHCQGLAYEAGSGILDMNLRSYEERRPNRLGYYSTEELVADVDLEMSRLKISSIHLLNSESLTLNWSTNSRHDNRDIRFVIKLISEADGSELLSMELDGATVDQNTKEVSLNVSVEEGAAKQYTFPLTYTNGRFSLTLDAMMTAGLLEKLKTADSNEAAALLQTSSTSITRFGGKLAAPLNIYATVQAFPTYQNMDNDTHEYQQSSPTRSNVANSMFADGSVQSNYQVAAFRHLSNIRYVETAGNFPVIKQVLDWQTAKAPVYLIADGKLTPVSSETVAFPAIAELKNGQTLKGNQADTVLRGLRLDETSIPASSQYLGLFCVSEGSIQELTLDTLTLNYTGTGVRGVGGFCGYSAETASFSNLSAKGSVNVTFQDSQTDQNNTEPFGAGALVGVLYRSQAEDLRAEGNVTVRLPQKVYNNKVKGGIGGIAGYADLTGDAGMLNCANSANVTGNLCVGGIVGCSQTDDLQVDNKDLSDLYKCTNDGLILYEKPENDDEIGTMGHYVGGIAGYAEKTYINDCVSSAGHANGYAYTLDDQELLRGTYVGGILGFGKGSQLYNCSTLAGGYVLGKEYVGGIVGGLDGGDQVKDVLKSTSVTRNASYVIGYDYVGGICGRNTGDSTIDDCVNNGVAVGYGKYIGGICGSNEGQNAEINNCASYISDTGGTIYRTILAWQATGDYVGGLVGYNSGKIAFNNLDSDKPASNINHAVASIVVGKNYVGGLVGFNDAGAEITTEYELISGRIHASGDCVGGLVGLNASTQLMGQAIEIKPNEVQGRYFVGGAIGANLVKLTDDVTMNAIVVNNSLGSVTAEAFCGGLMGYCGTYDNTDSLVSALENNKYKYLPSVQDTTNIPAVPENRQKGSTYIITIGNKDGNKDEDIQFNNMDIRAYAYFGGILGYAQDDVSLHLINCVNAGDLEKPKNGVFDSSPLETGVDVKAYLEAQEYTDVGELNGLRASVAGGIVGVNGRHHVIDSCENLGAMNGITAMGGIVGLNQGLVFECTLEGSLGSSAQDYIGGIVGLNVGQTTQASYKGVSYTWGTVFNCFTNAGITVTGRDNVGGIVGYNMNGGAVRSSVNYANVTGRNNVGGLGGKNAGTISITNSIASNERTIQATGSGAGGIIGLNAPEGKLNLETANQDIIATDSFLTVWGREKAGGIVGINQGAVEGLQSGTGGYYLVNQAKLVRATVGYAGGIIGYQEGEAHLSYAKNSGVQVTADTGAAGGIVSINEKNNTISNCINDGDVISNNGYAGGIVSENYGTVETSTVRNCKITSKGRTYGGAICGVNYGTISGSTPEEHVTLEGTARYLGAVTGLNEGTVKDCTVTNQPDINVTGSSLVVGGAVGHNNGTVSYVNAKGDFKFSNFQYLGGVVGLNEGVVQNSTFSGTIEETGSTAGNCYGGIAGLNRKTLKDCTVSGITINATGVYTATSTSTTAQKEQLSTHIGGIAGKNDTEGRITGCTIGSEEDSTITVANGMVGGVTGFNKGIIETSGAENKNYTRDTNYVAWTNNRNIEQLAWSNGGSVTQNRTLTILMQTNGNLGGIAGYNSPSGQLTDCVSGYWLLNNKSEGLGLGTGGIIGMNESEKNLSGLINWAFVGRQLKSVQTDRFAGGIIGNQINLTTNDWEISDCINYGTVYCYNTHYSGGIIGQWTGNGGTILNCYNYGNLQTTYQAGWVGASAGIVAQLYHPTSNQNFNIISCQNHGSIYGRGGKSTQNAANDSAGILGNVTGYYIASGTGPTLYINVVDCVNGPGVEIYSGSMAAGIFGFISIDSNRNHEPIKRATQNYIVNISRCRNYTEKMYYGSNERVYKGGILGDRYGDAGKTTYIQDCFSVAMGNESLVSLNGSSSTKLNYRYIGNNYYFDQNTFSQGFSANGVPITLENQNQVQKDTGRSEYDRGATRWATSIEVKNATEASKSYGMIVNNPVPIDDDQEAGTRSYDRYRGFSNANSYIGENDIVFSRYDRQTVETARVLFYYPSSAYNWNTIRSTGNDFDQYVRTAYGTYEQVENGQLEAPTAQVAYNQNTGTYTVTISDQSKPLYYELKVTDSQGKVTNLRAIPREKLLNGTCITTERFYLEDDNATIQIRGISMYEDVEPSAWITPSDSGAQTTLPAPQVEGTLVYDSATNTYRYRFELKNPEVYTEPGWTVQIALLNGTMVTLNADKTSDFLDGVGTQEMTVQALPVAGSTQFSPSVPLSYSVNFPEEGIPGDNAKPSSFITAITGNTMENLEISGQLTWPDGQLDNPPIYRVELLGTVDGQEVVLAYTDVLAAAGSTVTATFRDLPQVVTEATNLHLRAWYADTGLGSILTYQEVTAAEAHNVTILADEEQSAYTYLYSTVLANEAYFGGFIRQTPDLGLTFLTAPVLMTDTLLEPDWIDGQLYYRFYWDGGGLTNTDRYTVELYGLEGVNEVLILTDVYDGTGREFTVNADDWTYSSVRLTVTRVGVDGKEIGQSSTQEYSVRRRLEAPGQPLISNANPDELMHDVSWTGISNETGCSGYEIYVGTEAKGFVDVGSVDESGLYHFDLDLNAYQGQTVDVYLVAKAPADSTEFVDSPNGTRYTITVPQRLAAPTGVTWSTSWTYGADDAVDAEAFVNGGLRVAIQPNGYSLPGGSAFILRAEILDNDGNVLYTYDEVAMLSDTETEHYHDLTGLAKSYAGKYIRFSLRASYGNGMVSSDWADSAVIRLPMVKLDVPVTESGEATQDMTVWLGNSPDLKGQVEELWQATLRTLTWTSVEQADVYRVTVTNADGSETQLRIYENDDGIRVDMLVNGTWQTLTADGNSVAIAQTGDLLGQYTFSSTLPYFTYTMGTYLSWVENGDGTYTYTLQLPNISTALTQNQETLSVNNNLARVVEVVADVQENLDGESEYYTKSDSRTHGYGN